MAMQIMPAKIFGEVISYTDDCPQINVSEALQSLCDEFFKEEQVIEDGEEITIEIARFSEIIGLSEKIEKELMELLEKLRTTKGVSARAELIDTVREYIFFSSLIVSALASDNREIVLTIS